MAMVWDGYTNGITRRTMPAGRPRPTGISADVVIVCHASSKCPCLPWFAAIYYPAGLGLYERFLITFLSVSKLPSILLLVPTTAFDSTV